MGLRFRKSIKLVPGVRLNVGLRRASLSLGGKGFTYNVGTKGSRVTVGIPGSGLSYTAPVSHQSSVGLLASSSVGKRKFSATPLVIIAFVLGLIYLSRHPTTNEGVPPVTVSKANTDGADITGSIAQSDQGASPSLEAVIPLPRPRPKPANDRIGPPLQLVPQ
jgi:Protein of unknown function (DUF4236)